MKEEDDLPESADQVFLQQNDNPEFREHYVLWVKRYCKDEGRKWGHVTFAKALIKNVYPNHAENKIFIEKHATPFYETLRSLLYRKGNIKESVITLKNNRHLLNLIILFIYREDYDFLKRINYGIRLENIAQSILGMTGECLTDNSEVYFAGFDKSYTGGVYKNSSIDKFFFGIKDWHEGYFQVFQIEEITGEEEKKYSVSPGVLIRQKSKFLGFMYYEINRSIKIYWFELPIVYSRVLKVYDYGSPDDLNSSTFDSVSNKDVEEMIKKMELSNGA